MISKPEPVEELKMILYPEGLEMSNVITLMNEDLSFTITDLCKLKEIQKLYIGRDSLIEDLKQINFLKVEEDKVTYTLSDSLIYFNFLNIPGKLTKEEILKTMNLEEAHDKYQRFYKKYLYWQLVSDNRAFCEEFEKTLKGVKFLENTNLRYEFMPQSLKETLIKKIQQNTYSKEAAELKASPDKIGARPTSNSFHSNDSGSWRKRSNDLTSPGTKDSGNGAGMQQSYGSSNNNSKITSVYANTGNGYRSSAFNNDVPFKRERFNSDGDRAYQNQVQDTLKPPTFTNSYSNIFGNPVKLDYTGLEVKYTTEIKHKYTNKELFEIYEKVNTETTKVPEFSLYVDDVCSETKKSNLRVLTRTRMYSEDVKKDRARTLNDYNSLSSENSKYKVSGGISNANWNTGNSKTSATVSTKVPRNNPLQDMKYNPSSLFK